MATNMFEDFQSLDFQNPESARAWLDGNANLTPREQRNVERWITTWESELGHQHVQRLDTHSAAIAKEVTALVESLEADCREAAELPGLLKNGRITAKEATKRLAELAAARKQYVKILEAVRNSTERWESNAEAAPSDLLRSSQQRFATGAPRYGLRSLTAKVLRGDS